ncbi:hypothetical protein V5799_007042 [Amblyomma americanum]|uniref:Uncharacterized protein n=1 Tax=Amblyomma americanum TaxID=6943 RepID=A0AAQ4DUN2_AMBAM
MHESEAGPSSLSVARERESLRRRRRAASDHPEDIARAAWFVTRFGCTGHPGRGYKSWNCGHLHVTTGVKATPTRILRSATSSALADEAPTISKMMGSMMAVMAVLLVTSVSMEAKKQRTPTTRKLGITFRPRIFTTNMADNPESCAKARNHEILHQAVHSTIHEPLSVRAP